MQKPAILAKWAFWLLALAVVGAAIFNGEYLTVRANSGGGKPPESCKLVDDAGTTDLKVAKGVDDEIEKLVDDENLNLECEAAEPDQEPTPQSSSTLSTTSPKTSKDLPAGVHAVDANFSSNCEPKDTGETFDYEFKLTVDSVAKTIKAKYIRIRVNDTNPKCNTVIWNLATHIGTGYKCTVYYHTTAEGANWSMKHNGSNMTYNLYYMDADNTLKKVEYNKVTQLSVAFDLPTDDPRYLGGKIITVGPVFVAYNSCVAAT